MLYYSRLMRLCAESFFTHGKDCENVFEENRITVRAMLTECNLLMVMDNSRYCRGLDLGKFHMLIHYRKLLTIIRRGWKPLTVSVELDLVKPIKIFQKYQISSRVISIDDGYVYMVHKFISGEKVYARAISKGCFVSGTKRISTDEVNKLYGVSQVPDPEIVGKWTELKQSKKNCI